MTPRDARPGTRIESPSSPHPARRKGAAHPLRKPDRTEYREYLSLGSWVGDEVAWSASQFLLNSETCVDLEMGEH